MIDTREATRCWGKGWIPASVFAALFLSGPPATAQTGGPQAKSDHALHAADNSKDKEEQESLGTLSIPDVAVLDQHGNRVGFHRDLVKGKVVAINFVFTTCTTICPPLGTTFAKLQQLLLDRGQNDVALISVSVDPVVDTPERLKAWAAIFGARPGWTLVTGEKREIDTLLKALKVFTPDKQDHSPIVLLGNDAKGVWTRAYGLAPPAKLASLIERFLTESATPGETNREVRR